MFVAVDFDGVVVDDRRPYDDITTPLQFMPGARRGLLSLKRADHKLLLYSARANRALREDPYMDPLVRAGVRRVNTLAWEKAQPLHEARYQQMLVFVALELPGVFDAIDDGRQGKPEVDLFLDDRAVRMTRNGWGAVAQVYGEPVYDEEADLERRKTESDPHQEIHERNANAEGSAPEAGLERPAV